MKGITVASMFDGMSCIQQALDRLNIKVDKCYASEIDPYAISVTQYNYPDTIQLGDIREIKGKDLGHVDLFVGGSPCQGFSFSGHRLNFEDPRSKLFFEYVRVLNECREINPDIYFLLENVRMSNKSKDVITKYMGVEPININSALVSAQSRNRLYWTNIPNVKQPQDRGIMLKDILIDGENNLPMYSNIYGGFGEKKPRVHYDKSVTIRTASGGGHIPSVNKVINTVEKQTVKVRKHEVDTKLLVKLLRENKTKSTKEIADYCGVPLTQAEHWFRQDSSFAIPQATIWYKLKEILGITTNEWDKRITEFEERDGVYEMSERITQIHGKNPTLKTGSPNKIDTKYYLKQNQKDHVLDPTRLKKKYTAIDGDKALTLIGSYPRLNGTHVTVDDKYYLSLIHI